MKMLITQVGSYLTGDAIAEAVFDYWAALTRERRADVVRVPIMTIDGERSYVSLTIGWMTSLAAVDRDDMADLEDGEAVRVLAAKTRGLHPNGDRSMQPSDVADMSLGHLM